MYIQGLNTNNYLGSSDWRLPTTNELQSLIDYSRFGTATTFPNAAYALYWASATYVKDKNYAWYVNFIGGHVYKTTKNTGYKVCAVRGWPLLVKW